MKTASTASPVNPVAMVLTDWYALHSTIRRLWAVETSSSIKVLLTLEPTLDGSDTSPAWFANAERWANELRERLDRPIALQLIEAFSLDEIEIRGESCIADLCWRDPCAPAS
jgi:hypothetical protein